MTFPLFLAAIAAAAGLDAAPTATRPLEVLARLERPALALAPFGADRLVTVDAETMTWWRAHGHRLVVDARREAPPADPVRWPGCLTQSAEGDESVWVLCSGWREALLVGRTAGDTPAVTVESRADALPWPGAGAGIRFRDGTNLAVGALAGLGEGPYLALTPDGRIAVDGEGRLRLGDAAPAEAPLRVGSAIVRPWPEIVVASAPVAGRPDALLVIAVEPTVRILERIDVDARIRAVAARVKGDSATLLISIDDAEGPAIAVLPLARPRVSP